MFSSKTFMVSSLSVRCFIHFSLYFCIWYEKMLFFIFTCSCPVFPSPLIEDSCLHCHRLTDHKCMGLFLGSLFFFSFLSFFFKFFFFFLFFFFGGGRLSILFSLLIYVSVFCSSPMLFWLLWLCNKVWTKEAWYLPYCSFSKLFWLFKAFCVSINFFKYLIFKYYSSSVKNVIGILIGTVLNL